MTHPTRSKSQPSRWAVGLLVISTAFALMAIVLAATGYNPT